uniref:Cubilin n=1 Tax=Syphacia muris TaxID=451379 RepID=A0A158R3Q9_9BILA
MNDNEIRSRIVMIDGNIYLYAGNQKNITFQTSNNGRIFFNGKDVQDMFSSSTIYEIAESVASEKMLETTTNVDMLQHELHRIQMKYDMLEEQVLNRQLPEAVEPFSPPSSTKLEPQPQFRRIRQKINQLRRRLTTLETELKRDKCSGSPCRNGATCLSLFNKYKCLCPNGYQGENCETVADLCRLYRGTGLGCQNGGTCIRVANTFICHCPPGFHGRYCQTKKNSCDEVPDLCGSNGHCLPAATQFPKFQVGYKCICDWGYRLSNDTNNPTCEDIDECKQTNPCYPGSSCINLPGSFKCATCPPGMTGTCDGIDCVDIDECSDPNLNICSKDPPVQCINTIGSYKCSSCPAGYVGDGRICTIKYNCIPSPCHPKAKCYEATVSMMKPSGYVCICPSDFEGDGVGADGCKPSVNVSCKAGTCLNGGQCVKLENDSEHCVCPVGYAGKRCEQRPICANAEDCNNHGICARGQCLCMTRYYGHLCEYETFGGGRLAVNKLLFIKQSHFKNKVIKLVITAYVPSESMQPSAPCTVSNANMIIRDGPIGGFPIATFCDFQGQMPTSNLSILSSSSELTVQHQKSADSSGQLSFSFIWETVSSRCGGSLFNKRGEISLLNYNESEVCQWHIYAKPGSTVSVQVESLKLASGSVHNCSVNLLEFYDGLVVDSRSLLQQLCSSESSKLKIVATLPYLTIYFRSNYPATFSDKKSLKYDLGGSIEHCSRGFLLWYDEESSGTNCGSTINVSDELSKVGQIASPNFGLSYPPNLNCIWILDASNNLEVADNGFILKAEFEALDLPSTNGTKTGTSDFCPSDVLYIYDGGDISKPKLGEFCNEHRPIGEIFSSGPKLTIQFSTNSEVSGTGFKMKYSSVCEKHFDADMGTVSSWNYPNGTNKNFKCTYVIDSAKTKAIRLKFIAIKLGNDLRKCFQLVRGKGHSEDYVEFVGGHSSHHLINRRYYCASYPFYENGEMIASASQPLKIIYSASSANNKGFVFEYKLFDIGIITHFYFLLSYEIFSFVMNRLLEFFLLFLGCGGIFEGSNGTVTSPGYPERYLQHMHCIYLIKASPDKRIRLHFDIFNLEQSLNDGRCVHDSVSIYDSYVNENETSHFHGNFCGSMLPPITISTANTMALVFVSDRSIDGLGFSAKWEAVDADVHSPGFAGLYGDSEVCDSYPITEFRSIGNYLFLRLKTMNSAVSFFNISYEQIKSDCNGKISGMYGSLSAPQYPLTDTRKLKCKWIISVTEGNRIVLNIEKLDNLSPLESSGECRYGEINFLRVYDGATTSSDVLRNYCKSLEDYGTLYSKSNFMLVQYQLSSQNKPVFGFVARYRTECNNITLSKHNGILKSPGYPDMVFVNRNCHWTIRTNKGSRLQLTFHYFHIAQSIDGHSNARCFNNYLQFDSRQLNLTDNQKRSITENGGRYCSEVGFPAILRSNHNEIDISFASVGQLKNHFWLSWNTIGCGGNILFEKEIFANLNDLDEESTVIECLWNVATDIGKKINFVVEEFLVFSNLENCTEDAAQSFEGLGFYADASDVPALMQKKICSVSDAKSITYTSTSNELVVYIRISRNMIKSNSTFFKASVSFVPAPDFEECGGVISDVLRVQPKIFKLRKEIVRKCSLFQLSLVTFRTVSAGPKIDPDEAVGFGVTVSLRCGGKFLADGVLRSVRLDHFSENDCEYIIEATSAYEHVFLRVDLVRFIGEKKSATISVFDGKGVDVEPLGTSGGYLTVKLKDTFTLQNLYFSYSGEVQSCGGVLQDVEGTLFYQKMRSNIDCEWQIKNTPGNKVLFRLEKLNLPASEYCTVSFVEVSDATGDSRKVLERRCDGSLSENLNATEWVRTSLIIRLRYTKDDTLEKENNNVVMKAHFKKVFGGRLLSMQNRIESPLQDDWKLIGYKPLQWNIVAKPQHFILIKIEKIEIPPQQNTDYENPITMKGLIFAEGTTSPYGPVVYSASGYTPPKEFMILNQEATIFFRAPAGSYFSLSWEEIPKEMYSNTSSTVPSIASTRSSGLSEFNCGSILMAEVESQYIVSPGSAASDGSFTTLSDRYIHLNLHPGGYLDDLRCRWIIQRPLFSSVFLRIVSLDLETHSECKYDFLSYSSILYDSPTDLSKIPYTSRSCLPFHMGRNYTFRHEAAAYVYFFTDSSQNGRGFVLEYKLVYFLECGGSEFIPSSAGLFDATLSTPKYPSAYDANLTCEWNIVLSTNRPIAVEFVDMDIEDSANCNSDYVSLSGSIHDMSQKLCGKLIGWNTTFSRGSLSILFKSDAKGENKGFSLHIKEVVTDCSSDKLILREGDGPKLLTSPNFPQPAPHSAICRWLISAPIGHRVKFTVDPRIFHTTKFTKSNPNACDGNYLEFHDGPSSESASLGRYCQQNPPGTIMSTGSYLLVVFESSSLFSSSGFNATYEIASCGGTVILPEDGEDILTTPGYPLSYPTPSECDWYIVVPAGHFVNVTIETLGFLFSWNCAYNNLSLWDGYYPDKNQSILEPVCGEKSVAGKYFTSSRNVMKVSFRSNATSTFYTTYGHNSYGFKLSIRTSKIACGGRITDSSGRLESPGFPGPAIFNSICEWIFSAGFNYVYELELHTLELGVTEDDSKQTNYTYCYPEIYVYDGLQLEDFGVKAYGKHFCEGKNRIVSSADYLSVTYDGRLSQLYSRWYTSDNAKVPPNLSTFYITYKKLPRGLQSCMYEIKSNISDLYVGKKDKLDSETAKIFADFCHIAIKKPINYGTVVLHITDFDVQSNFSFGDYRSCINYGSEIVLSTAADVPWPYYEKICNDELINSTYTALSTSSLIDFLVYQSMFSKISFNISVVFYECGGFIVGPDDGVITSPGYNQESGTYPSDIECLWILKAPEGQVVRVNITDMELQFDYDCRLDELTLYEGYGKDIAQIHQYCSAEGVHERFQESIGRILSFHFHSAVSTGKRGFKINYSFHSASQVCGFTRKSRNGTIMSPQYPNDYPNNVACVWDISVPLGYRIILTFTRFAIQKSVGCAADSLTVLYFLKINITQEHQSRGTAPLLDYNFYYDQSALMEKLCGHGPDHPIETESNRMRLEFRTDASVTDKGFLAQWNAECGAVFRQTHGTVTSPYYPDYYPDEDLNCEYIIEPDYEGTLVLVLKVMEFELSPIKILSKESGCNTDFLEVRDKNEMKIVALYCANAEFFDPISIKGPAVVRFSANSTFRGENGLKKMYKGFMLTYAVSKCGGDVILEDEYGGRSKEITSPGFSLSYHHDLQCVWNITAPTFDVITIKFLVLQLERSEDCSRDYVELLDSSTNQSKSLGSFCGFIAPSETFVTSGPKLTINFVTDDSVNHQGFKLIVTGQMGPSSGCGGQLSINDTNIFQTGFELKSPTDPKTGLYYSNLRCGWTIKTVVGQVLHLAISKLDLEPPDNSSTCHDFLRIYDGYDNSSPLLVDDICGSIKKPIIIKSSYRAVYVYFETDSENSQQGFKIHYSSELGVCGGAMEAKPHVKALEYHSDKGLTRDSVEEERCRWHLFSSKKMPLRITFRSFSIPSKKTGCADSYMEIRDIGVLTDCRHPACAVQNDSPQFFKHCGDTLPPAFISRSSVVEITTVTYIQSEYTAGFSLGYQTLDSCNRNISIGKQSGGRITSPNYPNYYNDDSECTTSITAEKDFKILLVFKDFSLEKNSGSAYSRMYLQHLDGYFRRGKVDNTNQGHCIFDYVQLPPTFFSTGNALQIRLKTDINEEERGYDAYYFATRPKTLLSESTYITSFDFGEIHELQGAITNIGFPNGYAPNQRMRWQISPPAGNQCTLSLKVMDFGKESDGECKLGDHITLSEIVTSKSIPTANSFTLPCRQLVNYPHNIPMQLGVPVVIEFFSDNNTADNGNGFRIEYECINTFELQHNL